MTSVYKFKAGFTKVGVNSIASPSPTVSLIDVDNDTLLVTSGTALSLSNMTGVYFYNYTGTDNLNLVAHFHSSDSTLDQRSIWDLDNTSSIITQIGLLPTATQIDTQLTSSHGTGSWGGGGTSSGVGAITVPVTITVLGVPTDGVEVWVTSDIGGTNIVASGFTNTLGVVTFYLDAGTYYCWKQFAGTNFTNPETLVVT